MNASKKVMPHRYSVDQSSGFSASPFGSNLITLGFPFASCCGMESASSNGCRSACSSVIKMAFKNCVERESGSGLIALKARVLFCTQISFMYPCEQLYTIERVILTNGQKRRNCKESLSPHSLKHSTFQRWCGTLATGNPECMPTTPYQRTRRALTCRLESLLMQS